MKKKGFAFGIVMLIFVLGIFAISAEDAVITSKLEEVIDNLEVNISSEIVDYVESFVEKREISPEEIIDIEQVDFNALPKEVNIENVGDHNLAIYQVDYTEDGKEESVFVITYSVE